MAAWQIPLAAQPPQISSPQQVAGQVLTLKHLQQQNQMGVEQLKAAQMANEERVRQIHDEQVMRDAYLESNGDMAKFEEAVRKRGGSPKAVMAVQQSALNMKKAFADMDKSTREATIARHDQLRGEILGFEAQDEPTRQANWGSWLKGVAQRGLLTPAEFSEYSQSFKEYPGSNRMKAFSIGLAGGIQAGKEVDAAARTEAIKQNAAANTKRAETGAATAALTQEQKALQVAGQKLGAATNLAEYRTSYGKLTVDEARKFGFHDPDSPDFDFNAAVTRARNLGMSVAQQTAAAARATQPSKPITSRTAQGTFLVYPNGPDKPPVVQEVKSPSGASLATGGGGSQDRLAENDRRRELNSGIGEERKLYADLRDKRFMLAQGGMTGANGKVVPLTPEGLKLIEEAITANQQRLAELYARRVQLGYSKAEDVGFPTTLAEADAMEKQAHDAREKVGSILATKDGEQFDNPFDAKNPKQTMTPEVRRQWTARFGAANQTLINAQVGRRNLGAQPGATSGNAAQPSSERKPPVNNPGAIKLPNGEFKQYGSEQEGWDDLRGDLAAKIAGKTKHGLNADSTLLDLAKVWAPKGDGNNKPEDWAHNAAAYLKVSPKTPIGNYAGRLDDLAQAVASAEGSKVPFAPAKAQQAAAPPAPAGTAPAAAAAPQIGQRFSNGKITVRWDKDPSTGQLAWIDEATKKPAAF